MQQFKEIYENLISNIIHYSANSDFKKVLYLHNFILSTVEYPKIRLIKILGKKFPVLNLLDNIQRNYFSVYGTLINKQANCFGIAKAVKLVLSDPRISIKCETVKGHVKSPTKGKIIHVWNIVYIDRKPYHLDTTFDITRNPNSIKKFLNAVESTNEIPGSKATEFCFERFLVSGKKLKETHLWNQNNYPICEDEHSRDEVKRFIKQLELKGVKFSYPKESI